MLRTALALLLLSSLSDAAEIRVIDHETSIPPGQTRAFEFGTVPQADTTVTLEIVARLNYKSPSGSSMFMRLKLNSRAIGAAKTRTVKRLLNRPIVSPVAPNMPYSWFDGRTWRLVYAPDFECVRKIGFYVGDPYKFVLDITDLTNPAAENRLEITNTANKHSRVFRQGGGQLVIQRLIIRTQPGASPTMTAGAGAGPVINTGQPGGGPAPYTGALLPGGGFRITTGKRQWDFATAISFPNAGLNQLVPRQEVDKTGQPQWTVTVTRTDDGGDVAASGPDYRVNRRVRFTARRVEVADTFTNAHADAPLGLLVRHELDLSSAPDAVVRIAGNPDPSIDKYYAPANPSVHVVRGATAVGMICEDTVFSNQAWLFCDAKPACAGMYTDMLYLPPGASRTLEWAVYPVASRDYYDFINLVRVDRGSNYTVDGPWAFFSPDTIIATPDDKLREWFGRLGIRYACYCGGWVDRKHDRKKIGFGTGVMDPYWADFRGRLKKAAAKFHRVLPGLKVLIYYDTQRDTSDGGHERFKDSWLTSPKGNQCSTNWSGVYSLTYSVVATLDDSFGKAMLDVAARYMDEMGVDGLYWDEMECTGYSAPLITYSIPDGCSCELDPKTYTVKRQIGITTLLGEGHRLAVIDRIRSKGGTLMGNGPACTRKLLDKHVQRMVEIQHNGYWHYQGNLDSTLGYASSRMDFGNWLRALRFATLLVGTRYTYEHEISRYVFPFTPIELHYGYMLGKERVITIHSGNYGWQRDASLVVCNRFDKDGKRHAANWPTVLEAGAARTAVELGEDEAAVLVRVQCEVEGADGTVIRDVALDGDALSLTASGRGELTVRTKGMARTLQLGPEAKRFTLEAKR